MKIIIMKISMIISLLCTVAYASENKNVTFAVGCFDVGASTLKNEPGVLQVTKGWKEGHEINNVIYDPRQTDTKKMENKLKEAGTYISTIPNDQLKK